MGKRKDVRQNSIPKDTAENGTDKFGKTEPEISPIEPVNIESPQLVPSQVEQPAAPANAEAPIDPSKRQMPIAEPRQDVAAKIEPIATCDDDPTPSGANGCETNRSETAAIASHVRARRLALLAAAIAMAAAVGAIAGLLATDGLARRTADMAANAASLDESRTLKETIARLDAERASIKASVDEFGKAAHAQFTQLTDRLDHFERSQAESAAKLAKIAESVDRLERRAAQTTGISADATGSIAAPSSPPETKRPARPPVVNGWVLRRVYNGAALIQGRVGLVAVEPGDNLPGLGRIETIRRQDGRWVVVTSRGLIVTR